MSSPAYISLDDFAVAIKDLPLASLHAKAAELRNSIYHMTLSNSQLEPFAAEGDADCADAIRENVEVMQRMRDRIGLLKAEVEGRGMVWVDEEPRDAEEQKQIANGTAEGDNNGTGNAAEEEQEEEEEEEEGVHL